MILQILVLLPEMLFLFVWLHRFLLLSFEVVRKPMSRVPMVFIISRGVDVVVVHEEGEVLQVEDGIAVLVLFPHRFITCEASPVIKLVSFVDYKFAPWVPAWKGNCFDIFD